MADTRATDAWLATLTPQDLGENVECPSSCCWGNDSGQHIRDGGYVCTHCGVEVTPEDMGLWLQGHIDAHLTEIQRLREWQARIAAPVRD